MKKMKKLIGSFGDVDYSWYVDLLVLGFAFVHYASFILFGGSVEEGIHAVFWAVVAVWRI